MFSESQPSLNQLGYLIAEASRTVVFVVGAGVSKPAGIPLWSSLQGELKTIAVDHINKKPLEKSTKANLLRLLNETEDAWHLGDALEDSIPQEVYDREVRRMLSPGKEIDTYKQLWNLNPSGLISLNLDNLARIALNGTDDQHATSLDDGLYERFLLLSRPFLFQVHGDLGRKKSWVLGARQRNKLLKNPTYRNFIKSLLSTRRLVIVGLRPDDIALQTLLIDDFRTDITRGVSHFWICPNPTQDAENWAKLFNVSIIAYEPSDEDHSDVNKILIKLSQFQPREPEALAAYKGQSISVDDLPPDSELRVSTVEDIRHRLNAAIKGLDETVGSADYHKQLRDLFIKYSGSLRMAWHVQPNSDFETIWGTKVVKNLGGGAFGGVWLAEDAVDGRKVAVKILHENVLHEKDFLEAFRRGVRAMGILSDAHVKGMVRFIAAYDVPACVFMEYIEGVDMEKAIDSDHIDSFAEAIRVVKRVAEIVLHGHELDKQVLHRDLKPSNVMIKYFWDPDRDNEVVVLDFDLSWYEGAFGKSMVSSAINNYIAPEQLLSRRHRYSSRHTAVDVFGVGMLLYYVASKNQPALNIQERSEFLPELIDLIRSAWPDSPHGISTYLGLVVRDATYTIQPNRSSMPTLIDRLEAVHNALAASSIDMPSDIGNLIIACELEKNGWTANFELSSLNRIEMRHRSIQLLITSGVCDGRDCLVVSMDFQPMEETPRGEAKKKYLEPKYNAAEAAFKKNNIFKIDKLIMSGGALTLTARMPRASISFDEASRLTQIISDSASKLLFT
jgi:serine/threonine protein kinase